MTHYNICIKSGTSGWFDSENNDLVLLRDIAGAIPRVSETLVIYDKKTNIPAEYTVTEVKYTYMPSGFSALSCVANVYCISKEGT